MRLMSQILMLLCAMSVLLTGSVYAQGKDGNGATPRKLEGVEIVEHLGDSLPLELEFLDEAGKTVKIADYFQSDKPVIVTLNYYRCPMLCGLVLNGMVQGLSKLDWTPGVDYEIVTVSIDPRETPDLAKKKKASYIESFDRPGAEKGWHFLTGKRKAIKQLAAAIGFGYKYDPSSMEYAHGAAIFLASPKGKLTRYLYGVQFEPKQLRLGLVEAGQGKLGNTIDQILLRCYHFDPDSRKYGFYVWGAMRLGGGLTVFLIAGMLIMLWRRERRRGVT